MTQTKEISVEEKLRALYDLQLVDSRIDEIRNVRGELPFEVQDLEDEVAGLSTRIEKFQSDLETIEHKIKEKKNAIDEHQAAIKKYTEQQKNVRNNREYNSITKEIEFQELEIQLAEKHIKELKVAFEQKNQTLVTNADALEIKKNHLMHKKAELAGIMAETAKEEEYLVKKAEEFSSKIDDRLLIAYHRIRSNVRNGMAVVSIERGASSGSYFTIPPQVQVEIATRKKIITDEHSGRILVDSLLAEEEKVKIDAILASF